MKHHPKKETHRPSDSMYRYVLTMGVWPFLASEHKKPGKTKRLQGNHPKEVLYQFARFWPQRPPAVRRRRSFLSASTTCLSHEWLIYFTHKETHYKKEIIKQNPKQTQTQAQKTKNSKNPKTRNQIISNCQICIHYHHYHLCFSLEKTFPPVS